MRENILEGMKLTRSYSMESARARLQIVRAKHHAILAAILSCDQRQH